MEEAEIIKQSSDELQPIEMQAAAQMDQNYEMIDYVKELFLNSLEHKKADKTKICLMRFCAVCMGVIAVTLVLAVVLAGPYLQIIVSDFDALTQKVLAIDVKAITDDAQALMAEANVTVKSAGETLDAIDIDSLNATVKELGVKVDSMDMKSLNEAIASLNEVVTNLSKFRLFG